MNFFAAQRFLSTTNCSFRAFYFGALAILTALTAHAQDSSDSFRGTWLLQTPAKKGLTLLLKPNGQASYFWTSNTDRTVYPGEWTNQEEHAVITWADQSTHRIQREALGSKVSYSNPNSGDSYTVQAEQIPQDILGQWAKAPSIAEEVRSEQSKIKGFYGIWKTSDTNYIFIEEDRSAASISGPHSTDIQGAWARQGKELHIAWDSGEYSILRENKRGFDYKRIHAGVLIEEDSTEYSTALRCTAELVPAKWLNDYQADRIADSDDSFFDNRRSALEFYRGGWIIKRGQKLFESIQIGRFGGLQSSRKDALAGSWRMDGQDIFMRWDDGMRSILNPIGHGFILCEYAAGRPLDGVPTRILAAAPIDSTKLQQQIKDRKAIHYNTLELSQSAQTHFKFTERSWSRRLVNWVWPFSDKTPNMLAPKEVKQTADSQDPWWWFLWSDDSSVAAASEITQPSAAKIQQPTINPAKNVSEKNWYWPF